MVDTTGNQEFHLDKVEIVEPQDAKQDLTESVVKVNKPRIHKKMVPVTIAEVKQEVLELTRPIEASDVLNVEQELTPKEVKLLQPVKCEKCNGTMSEQTLKH